MFEDTSIDIQTGELLGRYIAEERDSGRLLRACYEQLRAAATDETDTDAGLAEDLRFLKERAAEVSAALTKVRRQVSELRS